MLSPEELRSFTKVRPLRSLLQVLMEWGAIIGAIILTDAFWHPVLYIVAVAWIGARMHALFIMMHEASHYNLTGKGWHNDIISDVLLAWPFFTTTNTFRENHFAHHARPNTIHDPDMKVKGGRIWQFPKSGLELMLIAGAYLSGLAFPARVISVRHYLSASSKKPNPYMVLLRLAFYAVAIGLIVYFKLGMGVLIYWFIPMTTWLSFISYLRSIGDHYAINEPEAGSMGTRTLKLNYFERLFFFPCHFTFHCEHHRYPAVPFYNLPKLHRRLRDVERPGWKLYETVGICGLIREMQGKRNKHSQAQASHPGTESTT